MSSVNLLGITPPNDTVPLVGYVGGDSPNGVTTRLYFDPQQTGYLDIPKASLHAQRDKLPSGQDVVYVANGTKVVEGGPVGPTWLGGTIGQDAGWIPDTPGTSTSDPVPYPGHSGPPSGKAYAGTTGNTCPRSRPGCICLGLMIN
jgi:hypothetical protein